LGLLQQTLAALGRYGRWVLPIGLFAGALLSDASMAIKPLISLCIALLIFIACLRIDLSSMLRAVPYHTTDTTEHHKAQNSVDRTVASGDAKPTTGIGSMLGPLSIYLLILQTLLPVVIALLLTHLAISDTLLMAAVLGAAAAPLSGGPAMIVLLRGDATLALRILIIGTAILPITCLPALALLNGIFDGTALWTTSIRLLTVISGAMLLAALCRRYVLGSRSELQNQWLDGLSSLLLAFVVIGLMSGLHAPGVTINDVLTMLVFAISLNIALQAIGCAISLIAGINNRAALLVFAVNGGNRNIALFLTALPAAAAENLLLFIACYQVPMYLTPLFGRYVYRAN